MTQLFEQIVTTVAQSYHLTLVQTPAPLIFVASVMAASTALYFVTRGREFIVAGISSALFLVPFIR